MVSGNFPPIRFASLLKKGRKDDLIRVTFSLLVLGIVGKLIEGFLRFCRVLRSIEQYFEKGMVEDLFFVGGISVQFNLKN